ncbi:MAG: CYTH and CHAD domain-containing protein [Gammaproteobacteria bacterium]|nr:CYTH and CHAD domain-containing protein [Gammaproteobacteria bacterium]MBU3989932.1 CYTH and CHAD domain-containing protein [Gammaproteobacteria bacterium]MBU4003100.1 CYTH and CHAD domain-containing protein [Gammaproteobacteria bacterium]MBU4019942.1 CYTH and CHAD domain-containing protein [Gammaproteobacteria bacterium]MBU4096892.1 CYTH and CHAD domain-containing protein [Gammaproteobacteria bacterium]
MAEEIELKLALPEDAHRKFLRHPLLRKADSKQSFRLTNLYYDTPSLELRKRGIGLRLRAKGGQWLQTVKCAGRAAGGLSARPEWETPYAGHFEFSAIDDEAVSSWLDRPKIKTRLAPIFETNFLRVTWFFTPTPGTRIAVMLDRGWIAAAGQRQAISEVEIELIEGDAMQLFALAHAFAERVPLAPAPLSKADRGCQLFKQVPIAPVKAIALPLDAGAAPAEAFRQIALGCLDHLQRNHLGAIACNSADPEYVHQMRIATRRLRAAVRLFGPVLPEGFAAQLLQPLRDLMGVLGQARDLDVLFAEIASPVLEALPDEPRLAALVGIITEHRFAARQEALRFMASPRYGSIVLQALATLNELAENVKVGAGGMKCPEAGTASAAPAANIGTALTLLTFARSRLRRLRKKVLALAAQTRVDNPPSLHALRIDIKRLRYALEFFTPLAAPKAMRRMIAHLTQLQDTLGQINDLASAGELLMDCAREQGGDPRLREAVTLIGGWHGPRHHKLLKAVPAGLKQLGRLRLPKLAGAAVKTRSK